MHNLYYLMFVFVSLLKLLSFDMVSFKIDNTIRLINAQIVSNSITELSKLECFENENTLYLDIDKEILDLQIKTIIKRNLSFVDYDVKYYFYNTSDTYNNSNSVQILLSFSYLNKDYTRELRYEPI